MTKRRTFQAGADLLAIVPVRDVQTHLSEARARRVVEEYLDARGTGALHQLLETFGDSDREAQRRLATMLERGDMALVRLESGPPRLGTMKEEPVHDWRRPAPEPVQTTWVGLRLVDAAGDPVADEPYVVVLSDGAEVEGRTDADGRARHEGVARGSCRITFPRITPQDWESWDDRADDRDARGDAASTEGGDGAASVRPEVASPTGAVGDGELVEPPEQGDPEQWLVIEVETRKGDALSGVGYTLAGGGQTRTGALDGGGRLEVEAGPADTFTLSLDGGYLVPPGPWAGGRTHLLIAAEGDA